MSGGSSAGDDHAVVILLVGINAIAAIQDVHPIERGAAVVVVTEEPIVPRLAEQVIIPATTL